MADESEAFKRGQELGEELADVFFTGVQSKLKELIGDRAEAPQPAPEFGTTNRSTDEFWVVRRQTFEKLEKELEALYEAVQGPALRYRQIPAGGILIKIEEALELARDCREGD